MTQQIIVGLIVAACFIYMLRKFVFRKKTASGASGSACSKCNGCSEGSKGGGCH
ncbi:FeoB-associated Cys-rich membrane protein [uncultured Ottowia sp.]|uniref:FeoB-associated Cys-rich membrane protein n=1 Tax=uncultured Ottowia sp. TaxID=543067 RepID=UPI0025957713|nr:FeoB-associated Cys-rich membrane protein [uncultured Ottowia sp.]